MACFLGEVGRLTHRIFQKLVPAVTLSLALLPGYPLRGVQ